MDMYKTTKAVVSGGGNLLYRYARFRLEGEAVVLNAEITGYCPLNCPFCYFKAGWDCSNKKDLPAEEWRKIFLYYKRRGIRTLVITGGEPAYRPDVLQIAYEIFGRNLIIITNGLEPIAKNIKARIFLSVDGTDSVQDRWRGARGIIETIAENFRDDQRAMVSMTVMPFNAGEIKKVYELARTMNLHGITFSFYTPPGKLYGAKDEFLLEGQKLDEAVQSIRALMREDRKFVFMSEQILQSFLKKRHFLNCSLKAGWVLSLNPEGKRKCPCVIGDNPDCRRCGCIIPHIMAALKQEAIIMLLTLGSKSIDDTVRTSMMFALQKDYI